MNRVCRWQWLLLCTLAVGVFNACRGEDVVYIRGRVFDGVTGAQVENFSLVVELRGNRRVNAKVEGGEYSVGPIPPYQDYTVRVEAENYREFYAHVGGNRDPQIGSDAREFTAYREVRLFPTNVQTPATRVRVFLSNSQAAPSGFVRLVPGGSSALLADVTEGVNPNDSVATSVPTFLTNAADTQQAILTRELTNGIIEFAAGELVYGVNYNVTVFGVQGYGFANSAAQFTGGATDNVFLTLVPVDSGASTALRWVFMNTDNQATISNGSLVIGFSEPVEFAEQVTKASMIEALDDVLAARVVLTSGESAGSASGFAASGNLNVDADDPWTFKTATGGNDKGVDMTLDESGLTLTLTWNPSVAFMETGNESLYETRWAGLDHVELRRRTRAAGAETIDLSAIANSVGTVVGAERTVRMIPQP